jgi:hypothetical protein
VTHLWDSGNVSGVGFLNRFGVTFGGLDDDLFLLWPPTSTLLEGRVTRCIWSPARWLPQAG